MSKLWDDFEVVAEARVFFAEHRIHKLHEFAHVRPEKVSFFEDIVRLIPFAEGDSLKGPSTVLSAWVAAQDTSRFIPPEGHHNTDGWRPQRRLFYSWAGVHPPAGL